MRRPPGVVDESDPSPRPGFRDRARQHGRSSPTARRESGASVSLRLVRKLGFALPAGGPVPSCMTYRRIRRQLRRPKPTTDSRPPEARLEAMVREANEDRRHRMFERILDDLDASQAVVPWLNAVATLRDRLIIGEPETCHLAAMFAESAMF